MPNVLTFVPIGLPALILLIAGIILVGIEIFLPGIGLPGIAGAICLVLGVIFGANSPAMAVVLIICIIVILCLLLFVAMRSAARGRLSKTPLVLQTSTSTEEGFSSVDDESALIGAQGVAASVLRPSGIAEIGGMRYDVVTDGEFIKSGESVRVVSVEGRRIVVAQVREASDVRA